MEPNLVYNRIVFISTDGTIYGVPTEAGHGCYGSYCKRSADNAERSTDLYISAISILDIFG
jgi:hypothetical protein